MIEVNKIINFVENNRSYIKVFLIIVGISISMNMKSIQKSLPNYVVNFMKKNIFRTLIMFTGLYLYTRDVKVAFIVSGVFFMVPHLIDKLNIKEYFGIK